jgi:hypothetical protein
MFATVFTTFLFTTADVKILFFTTAFLPHISFLPQPMSNFVLFTIFLPHVFYNTFFTTADAKISFLPQRLSVFLPREVAVIYRSLWSTRALSFFRQRGHDAPGREVRHGAYCRAQDREPLCAVCARVWQQRAAAVPVQVPIQSAQGQSGP